MVRPFLVFQVFAGLTQPLCDKRMTRLREYHGVADTGGTGILHAQHTLMSQQISKRLQAYDVNVEIDATVFLKDLQS